MAAPTAFLAAGIMMMAAGWMIAISALGVYVAAGCGTVWGLVVFPPLVSRRKFTLPTAIRIGLPVLMALGGMYMLVRPFLPDPWLTNAKVEVIRRDEAGVILSKLNLNYVGPSLVGKVTGPGRCVSVSRIEFETDNRNQLRGLLIIDDFRAVPHTFLLPRRVDAIYRQSNGAWKEERSEAGESELSVELKSANGGVDGLEVKGLCRSKMGQSYPPYR